MVQHRILIVEDETMSHDAGGLLDRVGWHVVGWAGGKEKAMTMARDFEIDAALLDVNLNGETTFAVADILNQRHIPFVFATGYGADGVAERFRDVPRLTKPFQLEELDGALDRVTLNHRSRS